MAVGPNLFRRGAVYHWRRRLPTALVPCIGRSHLRISLNTKDAKEARHLGALLDAKAMEVFASPAATHMTKDQLAQLFRTVHGQHRAKLALLAGAERVSPTSRREDLLAMELARGEAYLLLSQQGADAHVGADVQRRLIEKGFDGDGIIRVIEQLEDLRDESGVKFSMSKLKARISETGAAPDAVNIAAGQPVYLRAMAEALLSAAERYGAVPKDHLDFAGLVASAEEEVCARPAAATVMSEMSPHVAPPTVTVQPPASSDAEPFEVVDGRVLTIGAKLVAKKVNAKANAALRAEPGRENEAQAKAKGWGKHSVRQAEGIFALFDRFLVEEYGFNDLSKLRQTHLAAFEEFLRRLHMTFGKSTEDRVRTIAELSAIAARKGPNVGTLEPGTLSRHLTYLGQLIRHAKGAGVSIDPDVSTKELRSEQPARGRDQRPVPPRADVEKLFHEPAFAGCTGWDKLQSPGSQLWHGAVYYGTLLGVYEGLRREEFCGLDVNDVVDDVPTPHLIIRFNDIRRIKNGSSARILAIHPEIIRLGFVEYVRAMRALGHRRLFEDLYSPSTNSSLGDRYYKQLLPSLRNAGVTPHQLRHFFSNALKQKKVAKEFRADLLGHMGESETDERYVAPIELELQLELLGHLPVVTAHLEPAPLQLPPWVEKREPPPWCRPNRKRTLARNGEMA